MIQKLVMDTCLVMPVWLNGIKIPKKTLVQYAKLYFGTCPHIHLSGPTATSETGTEYTSEAVLMDISCREDEEREDLTTIGFVNGMMVKSGAHFKAWETAILGPVVRAYNKKIKGDRLKLSSKQIKPNLALFVNCQVWEPTFDSPTKDCLVGPSPLTVSPDEDVIKKVTKWRAVKLAVGTSLKPVKETKVSSDIGLSSKWDDAIRANKEPEKCTLWFTEGDSAKTFSDTGVAAIPGGFDYHGSQEKGRVQVSGQQRNFNHSHAHGSKTRSRLHPDLQGTQIPPGRNTHRRRRGWNSHCELDH